MNKSRIRLRCLYILGFMITTQIACGTFDVLILTPTPSIITQTPKRQEIEKQVIPSTSPEPLSTSAQDLPQKKPGFSDTVYFSYEPDIKRTQRVFPKGTKQVFAIWNYYNMREGVLIKQVWYRNSQVWFSQESTWDYKRYGEEGIISDVTLYDLEKGLGEGIYWLRLFIDGIEQTSPSFNEKSSFRVINTNVIVPESTMENSKSIYLIDPRTILVQYQENTQKTISVPLEIASINWFPNNQHILISQRDRSNQDLEASPSGVRDELWIIDIETGIRIRLSTPEENLHLPSISPNGRFIAAISGTGQFKACQADLSIAIIELDKNYNRISIQYLENFTGLPNKSPKPYPVNHPVVPLPGKWLDQYHMMTAIKFPCTYGENDGIYILNLQTWQIERAP